MRCIKCGKRTEKTKHCAECLMDLSHYEDDEILELLKENEEKPFRKT